MTILEPGPEWPEVGSGHAAFTPPMRLECTAWSRLQHEVAVPRFSSTSNFLAINSIRSLNEYFYLQTVLSIAFQR